MAEPKSCTTCSGEGFIWWDACDHRGEHVTREALCSCVDGPDDHAEREDGAL